MSAETLSPPRAAEVSPVIARTPAAYVAPSVEKEEPSPVSPFATHAADAEVQGEAPVPRSFTARQSKTFHLVDVGITGLTPTGFFNGLAAASRHPDLAIRPKMETLQTSWVVYCNNCNLPMENEHYHCSICDHGDYDLCPSCVDSGIHCPGSNHWMVKRFVKNGCVVNSTTERVAPKTHSQPPTEQEMPGAFTEEKQPVEPVVEPTKAEEPTRTCNCCVQGKPLSSDAPHSKLTSTVLPEQEFVTCTSCDDYDLCLQCHISNKHGHHPAHAFKAATADTTMPALADFLCNAGRNVRHSAVCDGCEKFIYGVRHKCLNCPDWDFCSECIKGSKFHHHGHRFVPIYEPLAEPVNSGNRHYGIYCDGPLCKDKENQSYIEGIRYKCAVCHDKDFCANCEAHPSNRHNHTHPLIKFKRPVRSVSVTTMNEDKNGNVITKVGDREPAQRSTSTETVPTAPSSNAATQVHTIADVKPTEESQPKTTKEKIEIRDLLSEPLQEKTTVPGLSSIPAIPVQPVAAPKAENTSSDELDAHFIRDTIPDGSRIPAGHQFVQVWTLRNPGPNVWPAGCSVRHVGGDNMLNLDNTQPLSQSDLADASESNVIGRPVAPNEEVAFRIIMKAPVRKGTAISYWRLKKADGTPFGHRLWCDIQVVGTPIPVSAEPVESSPSVPTNPTPYERFQQAKMERYRALRAAHTQAQNMRNENTKAESELLYRLDAENQERLRNTKLEVEYSQTQQARMSEVAEREKMLRIQNVRKAAVERLLETRRKEHEAYTTLQQAVSSKEKTPEVPARQETAELPVEEKAVEKSAESEPQPQSSGMIFPQLDKESPSSSTHEAMTPQAEAPKSEKAPVATSAAESEDEFFEDAESVEIRSLDSDDGFMTDEEYDILDASDEEML
jgi:next-to-BRCA1 protein 1